MTWTCQEGSGSLLGNLISCFSVDRPVSVVVSQFDFFSTGETHDRRHPGLRPFLGIRLADEVARENAFGSACQFGLLRASIATDQFGTAGGIERLKRAGLGHTIEVIRRRGTPPMRGLDFEK